MNRLFAALHAASNLLDASGRGWALVGGLAVSARSEPRFTRDIDLAVSVVDDPQAERRGFARGKDLDADLAAFLG